MSRQAEWEFFDTQADGRATSRLKVPGGWLYRCSWYEDNSPLGAMTFVPSPPTKEAKHVKEAS